jgi:hypothetical protein
MSDHPDIAETMARAMAECDGCEEWERLPDDSQAASIVTKVDHLERARAALTALVEKGYCVVKRDSTPEELAALVRRWDHIPDPL